MGVVKKNTLNRFLKKIEKVDKYSLDKDAIFDTVINFGVETTERQYAESDLSYDVDSGKGVIVFYEKGNDFVEIVATHPAIAYIEFGTGRVGEKDNYDKTKLPQEGVPITGKWEYYYDSPSKTIENGVEGWRYGRGHNQFTEGRHAGKQLYNTSKILSRELGKEVMKTIKGE